MNKTFQRAVLPLAVGTAALLSGCLTLPGSKGNDADGASKPASAAAPAPAPAPAAAAPKVGPGMNERGEVVDAKKVEAGYGQKVKGLGDWEGEITGKPAPGSKFGKVQIGMSHTQVVSLVGQPTDQGAYVTGKAFIPFYFGSDKYRYEVVYKGQGRLIFASSAGYSFGDMHLIWIIHSASEQGFR